MADSDILFQDTDVCILNPNATRGVVIYAYTDKPVCAEGIKANSGGNIYFRAPFNSNVLTFASSYGETPTELSKRTGSGLALIRIDPSFTFVYLKLARSEGITENYQKTRISMEKYLSEILPMIEKSTVPPAQKKYNNGQVIDRTLVPVNPDYDGISPVEKIFPEISERLRISLRSLADADVQKLKVFFEIKVNVPEIPKEWLVDCSLSGGFRKRKQKKRKTRHTSNTINTRHTRNTRNTRHTKRNKLRSN